LEIGRPAVGPLDDALPDMDAEGRIRAERLLEKLEPVRVHLRRVALDSAETRLDALRHLQGYRSPRVVEALLPRLKAEADPNCLRGVVRLLSAQRDRRTWRPLLGALTRLPEGAFLEEEVLGALAEVADASAVEPLVQYWQDKKRPRAANEPPSEFYARAG